MSEMGQTLHSPAFGMSGLRPKATELRTSLDVRNVPGATDRQPFAPQQTRWLFNHLVGGYLQSLRNCNSKQLGGLEVDDNLLENSVYGW